MRKHLCVCGLLALAFAIAGCGSGNSQPGSTASNHETGSSKQYAELRWGALPWAGPLNFTYTDWPQVGGIESLAVQSLVEFGPKGEVKPGLASSIEHPNSTTYIYHIRSGVKFSSGKPLTIADVVFSLERNHGKEALLAKGMWEGVSSIAPSGDSTVVVKLRRPNPAWPYIMGVSSAIIEKAQAERVGEKALGTSSSDLPIGTGPWKFDSYQPEVSVHLSRNPYWSGPAQPAARITIDVFKQESTIALALRSGSLDGAFDYSGPPKTFASIPGTRLIGTPGFGMFYLAMNTLVAPFTDAHVRRAIAYATDIKGMTGAIFPSGLAQEGGTLFPGGMLSHLGSSEQVGAMVASLPKYPFNLTVAKQELARSAYPHGFTTTILALPAAEPDGVPVAQILSSDLAKIGITAKVRLVQNDEIAGLVGKKVTIYAAGQPPEYPDPSGLAALLRASEIAPTGSGYNFAEYKNAEVEKLLSEQAETVDTKARLKLIGQTLGVVEGDLPYRPLFSPDFIVALSNKYVFPPFSFWSTLDSPWALGVKLAS